MFRDRVAGPWWLRLWYAGSYYVGLAAFGFGIMLLQLMANSVAHLGPREVMARWCKARIRGYLRLYFGFMAWTGVMTGRFPDWPEELPQDAAVVVSNHPGMVDAPFFLSRLPRAFCIYKNALRSSVFRGDSAAAIGYVSNTEGLQGLRNAVARLRRGEQFLIFPEGTRSPGRWPGPYHGSYATVAKEAAAPVYVFWIENNSNLLGKQHRKFCLPQLPVRMVFHFRGIVDPRDFPTARHLHAEVTRRLHEAAQRFLLPPAERPSHEVTRQTDDEVAARLTIPAETCFFQGHFPEMTLAPGAFVLQQMLATAAALGANPLGPARKVRFLQEVRPGDVIELRARRKGGAVSVTLTRGEEKLGSCQVVV